MKVLQLCNKPPYPPVDGGTMAMNSVTQGLLQAGCEVKVLTVVTDKHPLDMNALPEDYRKATRIEGVYVDLGIKPLPAAVAALCGESYHVKRYRSDAFAQKLKETLQNEQFDIVHVESIFLTPYMPVIRRYSQAKVILRAHNVEHLIWKRVAHSTGRGLKRQYIKHLSLTLRAYELEHLQDYDGVVCITRNDAEYFLANGCRRPITSIPFGVEVMSSEFEALSSAFGVRRFEFRSSEMADMPIKSELSLFHIGAMDWMPNQESIAWLLEEVWPVIHSEVPQAHLYPAGRKMPKCWLDANIDGVTVVGEVPDAMEFIADKDINVVPLLSGSGIRVKIIEAMSVGKVVVATTVAAHGIDYTDGKDLLIADSPADFARQIKRCLIDREFCHSVGEAARKLISERYNGQHLTEELMEFYRKLTIEN